MQNKFLNIVFTFVFLALMQSNAYSNQSKSAIYNPHPKKGDILLPLPNGGSIVFRAVIVPGKSFWGDRKRIVQLGDASGNAFEGLQRLEVSGSFQDKSKKNWVYYLGKYEITKGQFIAVVGMENFLKESRNSADKKIAHLQGKALQKALSLPVSFITYRSIQNFINEYNKWLFDHKHPERIKNIPKIDGIPGFIRLPTEIEWEYAQRGGEPARKKGIFEQPLPFPRRKINKYVWHLKNAKNRTRPIGLRKPNLLGFYDMLGNVQEIVDGRFLPEIWQGKPGGIPVRGGSVSTPKSKINSALRGEFDAVAWDKDKHAMIERASFDTGFRLSIGSNVITSLKEREKILSEYEVYKKSLRASTPVGHTLNNLVAQAGAQLNIVNPIMARIAKKHPELKNDLASIQHYLDIAKKRLNDAQIERARSIAQDAARNGFNYSLYLDNLKKLKISLGLANKLLQMSTRYQKQVQAIENKIKSTKQASNEQFNAYTKKISLLGNYNKEYIKQAIENLEKKKMSKREQIVLQLISRHTQEFNKDRRINKAKWINDFEKQFENFNQ